MPRDTLNKVISISNGERSTIIFFSVNILRLGGRINVTWLRIELWFHNEKKTSVYRPILLICTSCCLLFVENNHTLQSSFLLCQTEALGNFQQNQQSNVKCSSHSPQLLFFISFFGVYENSAQSRNTNEVDVGLSISSIHHKIYSHFQVDLLPNALIKWFGNLVFAVVVVVVFLQNAATYLWNFKSANQLVYENIKCLNSVFVNKIAIIEKRPRNTESLHTRNTEMCVQIKIWNSQKRMRRVATSVYLPTVTFEINIKLKCLSFEQTTKYKWKIPIAFAHAYNVTAKFVYCTRLTIELADNFRCSFLTSLS